MQVVDKHALVDLARNWTAECGLSGDKSTQQKDIDKARDLAEQWRCDKKEQGDRP